MSAATAWAELAWPFQRCVELAWESCAAGTFACGAVITDPTGRVVAEGRNRAFDAPGGTEPLQGTVLAHAEMNALARVPTSVSLADCTLWSSLEPCLMCLASAILSSVGSIRYLAPDPLWNGCEQLPSLNAFVERRWPVHHEPHEHEWAVLGMGFGLHIFAFWQPDSQALAAHDVDEPETSALARRWASERTLIDLAAQQVSAPEVVAAVWPGVCAAAATRRSRHG